jgi:hypothetical protein
MLDLDEAQHERGGACVVSDTGSGQGSLVIGRQ